MYWVVLDIVLHIRVFKVLRQKVSAPGNYIPGPQGKYKKAQKRASKGNKSTTWRIKGCDGDWESGANLNLGSKVSLG